MTNKKHPINHYFFGGTLVYTNICIARPNTAFNTLETSRVSGNSLVQICSPVPKQQRKRLQSARTSQRVEFL